MRCVWLSAVCGDAGDGDCGGAAIDMLILCFRTHHQAKHTHTAGRRYGVGFWKVGLAYLMASFMALGRFGVEVLVPLYIE